MISRSTGQLMQHPKAGFLGLERPKGYQGTCRYLKLLQSGAHEAKLDDDYTKWLDAMDCVPNNERGQEYYTAPDGTRVKVRAALPCCMCSAYPLKGSRAVSVV